MSESTRGGLLAALGGLVLGLAACEDPVAEVVVVVRADAALSRALRSVRVEARRVGAANAIVRETYDPARARLPGRVAIIAADPDDTRPLEVLVTADVGDPGRGDFTHRAVTRFQRNAVLYLGVFLADRCRVEDVRADCASLGLTCGESGRCVSIERQGTASPPPVDAGAPDGGVDFVCRARATSPGPTTAPTCERRLDDAMERCGDGLDNDCDGVTDEGCCARSCDGATGDALRHCREVLLAGGDVTLGDVSDAGVPTPGASVPGPTVSVSPFRVDAYEATVARFRRFVAAGMPGPSANAVMFPRGVVLRPEEGTAWPVRLPVASQGSTENLCNWSAQPTEWESDPLNCVDWYTAMAFCVWDGGRLPTEAEWEFVARYHPLRDDTGRVVRAGRRYPWGDREPDCDDANFNDCDVGYPRATRPVGTRMNGLGTQPAWLEVCDLAGNLQEITVDNAESLSGECWSNSAAGRFSVRDPLCVVPRAMGGEPQRPHHPTLRGGSLRQPEPGVRTAARDGDGWLRTQGDRDVGFRCVRLR